MEQERLATRLWDTIVLDEAQTIKNPESQVARAAHTLQGKFRVTLSGTPVENRLDDLWSQFHFINPGLLGRREEFLEKFARPIGGGDLEAASRLKARIKPFILRRLKREVAPELPARTETVLHCELSPEERSVYEMILASTRKEVLATLEEGGSILKALEVILRLRQACCHRGLIPGEEASESSKTTLLMETLEESLSEGHKSLVFSQWTSYLDKIGDELGVRGIRYSRIDGSTRDRQGLVNEFQTPNGPPIMLISLKAGGVGLTLTAADHVFIMDPWWNPAVEDQAADRAHRIGQQNPVMIHRLVARESIEEKILVLQESKKDLARAVLDAGAVALSLTRQDILNLLN
jgi:SNF2 family DNA or RNA helicase